MLAHNGSGCYRVITRKFSMINIDCMIKCGVLGWGPKNMCNEWPFMWFYNNE